jgi:hypothetical protein
MKFDGQLAVGFFDFVRIGIPLNSEDFVIITLGHVGVGG